MQPVPFVCMYECIDGCGGGGVEEEEEMWLERRETPVLINPSVLASGALHDQKSTEGYDKVKTPLSCTVFWI